MIEAIYSPEKVRVIIVMSQIGRMRKKDANLIVNTIESNSHAPPNQKQPWFDAFKGDEAEKRVKFLSLDRSVFTKLHCSSVAAVPGRLQNRLYSTTTYANDQPTVQFFVFEGPAARTFL